MIEIKDIVSKVMTGCSHSRPILVPCSGCIESNMAVYESRIRESVKGELREQWKAMEGEVKRLADQISAMTSAAATLKANYAKVEAANRQLSDRVKSLVAENNDLKASATAERAIKAHSVRVAS